MARASRDQLALPVGLYLHQSLEGHDETADRQIAIVHDPSNPSNDEFTH
jgi:hypothetical protein